MSRKTTGELPKDILTPLLQTMPRLMRTEDAFELGWDGLKHEYERIEEAFSILPYVGQYVDYTSVDSDATKHPEFTAIRELFTAGWLDHITDQTAANSHYGRMYLRKAPKNPMRWMFDAQLGCSIDALTASWQLGIASHTRKAVWLRPHVNASQWLSGHDFRLFGQQRWSSSRIYTALRQATGLPDPMLAWNLVTLAKAPQRLGDHIEISIAPVAKRTFAPVIALFDTLQRDRAMKSVPAAPFIAGMHRLAEQGSLQECFAKHVRYNRKPDLTRARESWHKRLARSGDHRQYSSYSLGETWIDFTMIALGRRLMHRLQERRSPRFWSPVVNLLKGAIEANYRIISKQPAVNDLYALRMAARIIADELPNHLNIEKDFTP